MRAGGNCAVQQSLTAEAAGVVKQAMVLAKRRGHAQVTPLHVANTMLAAASGLFRVACLESHSHPLQCKALELCFNVALNRLPASAANPMIGGAQSANPSISNALVAAFKRAQAHQRRGSVESQQQPLLAVKIELEQLIISILDDPSVSRVMREAGFSSTQVKINVEKAISLQLCSQSSSPSSPKLLHKESSILSLSSPPSNQTGREEEGAKSEDLKVVIDNLVMRKKKRSLVLVGESISKLESTVKNLMDRVDRGEVPEALREVKFISIPPLYSFCNLDRDEVELKIRELTCLVQSLVGKGVVLYLGDLKWISDYRVSLEREGSYYCSVEHMIMEIGRLVWGIGEMERFWVMGIATFQTYMRCRNGYHSLQTLWGLHPLTIPVNTLPFTLVSQSDESKHTAAENGEVKLSCCSECSVKFEDEARDLQASANERALSRLPCWLKDESRRRLNDKEQNSEALREVCEKWNSFCNSAHKLTLLSSNPSPHNIEEHVESRNIALKEFNSENLNLLCNALEEKVPWHKEIIPEIAGTILQCRSGMVRRKGLAKEETWLLFAGPDQAQAKDKVARELAKIVFGSYSSFVSIGISSFVDSSEDCGNKRGRDECKSYIDRFAQALSANPSRVFLLEDLEQADYCSQMGLKRAIQNGRIVAENGHQVSLCDAIVILCCESFNSRSRHSSPTFNHQTQNAAGEEEAGLLDLNISFHQDDQSSLDDLGILQNIDKCLVFKIQDSRQ